MHPLIFGKGNVIKSYTDLNIINIISIALEAGKAIMEVYESDDFNVEKKYDDSPLTKADKISHKIIKEKLLRLYPDIPIISEEGKDIPYSERKNWKEFWLVDPLDGTKEFIKRNDEFTVNIALIENNKPVFGVVYAPAVNQEIDDSLIDSNPKPDQLFLDFNSHFSGTLYVAHKDVGSFKIISGKNPIKIKTSNIIEDGLTAVKSRSHSSSEEENILKEFNISSFITSGSSLKFCLVAEGKAHIYYRHGPTMEWDTAAGQAVVEFAGGIFNENFGRLSYNKENLLNGSFMICTPAAN